jgi:putative tricarboxylic transport membrane protein
LAYGYAAFFTMDALLPPFMQRNPVWPSTFPKVIAVLSILTAFLLLLGVDKTAPKDSSDSEMSLANMRDYDWPQALALLGLMVAYAFCLRPIGFLVSTFLFLCVGAMILGERRFMNLIPISAFAAGGVWYLVEAVLGIFLRPFPWFL